jgi:hypothetical protein
MPLPAIRQRLGRLEGVFVSGLQGEVIVKRYPGLDVAEV